MTNPSSPHPQKRLRAGGFSGTVDEGLVPLLREIWRAGIETVSSCQDASQSTAGLADEYPHMAPYVASRHGRAYIDFESLEGIEDFYTLVAHGEPSDAMRHRLDRWLAEGHWTTRVVIFRSFFEANTYRALLHQLSFPASDITEMAECLKRVREQQAQLSTKEPRSKTAVKSA